MGGGIIIQQRAEMKQAIGPGTANHARLPTSCQVAVKAITDKGYPDWTDVETTYVASMFLVAVNCR